MNQESTDVYLLKMKEDLKAFNNFFAILNKAEHDGYISSFL